MIAVRDEDAVMDLVREVYYLRKKGGLVRDPMPLARRTAKAVAAVVDAVVEYDPEADARVAWLRGVVQCLREHKGRFPRAAGEAEAWVQFLLGEMAEDKKCRVISDR